MKHLMLRVTYLATVIKSPQNLYKHKMKFRTNYTC